jgi:hypothetical protein
MFYYLTPASKGLPPEWFLGAVVIRDAMVVLLCVLVVRSILRPEADPVRTARSRSRSDDPDWPAPRPSGAYPLRSGSGGAGPGADPVRNGS